ncbi:leucyl-cystinyl aminopeptidase-like [Anticarsia gemmatalis]|uniref:leucyl-cystinyl aminopeptidase-like n=1 Tax=Anticarsia gemmatalis TaxID=129554 RepID=UPI003F7726F0
MECKIIRAFFVICLFSYTNAIDLMMDEECLNYTVYPIQYELNIYPYVHTDRSYFDCEVIITVIANAPNVNVINLDMKDLEIQGIKVLDGNRDILEHSSIHGKLHLYLKESLKVFNNVNKQFYTIRIRYRRRVTEDGNGIFLVKYYDEQSKDYKYLFTTRLSPNKAKYFFPCFENTKFEAVFKFRVYIIENHKEVQYTNTTLCIAEEQKRDTIKDEYLIIDYVPSPQVGLHQVGFHYSTFASKEARASHSNDTLILWAPIDEIFDFKFILNYGITIINLIQEYSKKSRPLVQGPINLVAVPTIITGYEVGSWNLLTNGAHRIVTIDQFTSIKQIEMMTFELAQQLSRIWLGNPGEIQRTRWKEEWFKEGMATYLAYYFMTQYNHGILNSHRVPLGAYGHQMRHKAMILDWHRSTPALETFNSSLAIEIPSRYKELVQMKTGAILWMLENWVESDKFHNSLVNYINSKRGKYISLQDFTTTMDRDNIECLHQFFNGSTASRILGSWLRRPGYPVINVQVLRDRSPNAIQLKQRQFSFTHENRGETDYLIPISYIVQNNQNCFNCYRPRFTIGAQSYTFGENLNDGWILLNRNGSGYYRVNYDSVTWILIAKTLKENMLSIAELNRAQIVSDVLALYVAGDIDIQLAMDILGYLDKERSPIVWEAVLNGFELFTIDGAGCNMTRHIYWDWQEFLISKVSTIYGQLVKSKDQLPLTRLFRTNVVELACSLNYEPCHAHVRRMYVEERRGKHNFFPDCRIPYFYVLANETFSNTYTRRFNAIEQDDKHIADHKIRERNRFLMKIPLGEMRPQPIVKAITERPVEGVTEKLKGTASSAISETYSILILLFSIILNELTR